MFAAVEADTTLNKPAAPVLDVQQAAMFDPYKKPAENAAVVSSFGLENKEGKNFECRKYCHIGLRIQMNKKASATTNVVCLHYAL